MPRPRWFGAKYTDSSTAQAYAARSYRRLCVGIANRHAVFLAHDVGVHTHAIDNALAELLHRGSDVLERHRGFDVRCINGLQNLGVIGVAKRKVKTGSDIAFLSMKVDKVVHENSCMRETNAKTSRTHIDDGRNAWHVGLSWPGGPSEAR